MLFLGLLNFRTVLLYLNTLCSLTRSQVATHQDEGRGGRSCRAMEPPLDGGDGVDGGQQLGVVPGSGMAGIFRAFFPSGNLVLSIMHAAAVPSESEDGRPTTSLAPMVARGGRVPQGDMGGRDEGPSWGRRREGPPVIPNEASHFHSNFAYRGKFGQNELDNRGISRQHKSEKRSGKEA